MSGPLYLLLAIAVMAAATFATRAASFLLLRSHSRHPLVLHLGRYLPPAAMTLSIWCVFSSRMRLRIAGVPIMIS